MGYQFALARYNEDGSLDTTFLGNGMVLTNFVSTPNEDIRALAIDGQNRIVVGGIANDRFALARYRANGNLDTDFDGDGKVVTNFTSASQEEVYGLAIDSQDRIVVAGWALVTGGWSPTVPPYRPDEGQFALARYRPNGSLDTDFGGDGKVLTNFFAASHAGSRAVAIDSQDRVVAGGWAITSEGRQFALARYNTSGGSDVTFGVAGQVTTNFSSSSREEIFALGIDSQDRIVVAGEAFPLQSPGSIVQFALARYRSDGSLDASFDWDGKVLTDFFSASSETAYALAIDVQNRIVVGGSARVGPSSNPDPGDYQFALARYRSNGSLDTSFDWDGKVLTDFFSSSGEGIKAMTIDDQGRIIVGGYATVNNSRRFALARYQPNGALDTSFDGDGKVLTSFSSATAQEVKALAIDADGKIVVGGSAFVP